MSKPSMSVSMSMSYTLLNKKLSDVNSVNFEEIIFEFKTVTCKYTLPY